MSQLIVFEKLFNEKNPSYDKEDWLSSKNSQSVT